MVEQQPQGQPEAGGGVKQLAEQVHSGLSKFMSLLEGAQVPPQVKEQLSGVIQGYEAFVEALLQGGGPQPQAEPRGPSAGGPGAVPAM